jgi:hypothetical protein
MRVMNRTASLGLLIFFILVSSLLLCPRDPNQLIAAWGAPGIVVDGDISDWQGIQPIVDDTGDVSSPDLYDLTRCYVLTDPVWLYFLFMKTPIGSAIWITYFDVDLSSQTGYQINNMGADFRFTCGGDEGFYNWTDNDWRSVDSSGVQLAWGGIWGDSWSNSTEWAEGRVALDALGTPASFRVVFHIRGGEDVAPKTGYITVVSGDPAVAVSFTSPRHVLGRNETSALTFRIQNHGPVDISAADVQIAVAPPLVMLSGANSWAGSINSGQTVEGHITAQASAYGTSTSNASFTFEPGFPLAFTIPLTIVTAPRIGLQIQRVTDFRLGAAGTFNVTVTNLDPYEAETTVEPMAYSDVKGFYMQAVLAPQSSQGSLHNVTLTEVGGFFFDLHAIFEGVELARTSSYVDVRRPNLWISAANVTTAMQLGAEYPLTVTIQNDEDYAYSVNVSAAFEYQQPGDVEQLTVDMPAKSTRTVILEVQPREQGTHYVDVSLTMYEVLLSTHHLYGIHVQPTYLFPLAIAVIAVIVVAAIASLTVRRRRRGTRRGNDAVNP